MSDLYSIQHELSNLRALLTAATAERERLRELIVQYIDLNEQVNNDLDSKHHPNETDWNERQMAYDALVAVRDASSRAASDARAGGEGGA